MRRITRALVASPIIILIIGATAGVGFAEDPDLAAYFGFDPVEVVKVGERCGPIVVADVNADGFNDIIVVNNHDSRIELLYQRPGAHPDDPVLAPTRVNEFPDHWRFRREFVSVTHRVSAVICHDFDHDGRPDIIYAGHPAEIVFLRQSTPGVFEVNRRHRVKNLEATRDGFGLGDVLGDPAPELLAIVNGKIQVWPLTGDALGDPVKLAAAQKMIAFLLDDLNGDGRTDIAGIIPENPDPVRIWLGAAEVDAESPKGVIGAQVRLEMPPLLESDTVHLPGRPAARLAVIERVSKRIVVYEIITEEIEESGDRDAAIRVQSFTDAGNRNRDHTVVDLDGDGRLDLLATDTEANAVVSYRQRAGRGFQAGERHPSLSELTYLVAGNVDDDPAAEIFVLSEKEGVVGRSDVETVGEDGRLHIPFPRPVNVSSGHTPTALKLVHLEDGPRLAVVGKDGRDYVLDLIDMQGQTRTIELGKLSRSPETIVALDADQDGRTDLLLFTREKPMTMLAATDDGFDLLESKDMGQFGLVKAARAANIAVIDVDGDGLEELLIADKNFVRAVHYDLEPGPGVSPGWQVVLQINARDSASKLVSITVLGDRIAAADKENDRLVIMAREKSGSWSEVESLTVRGFAFGAIHAGAFSGDDHDNVLAVGNDGFVVLQLAGDRLALKEVGSWRFREEHRRDHELASGDVNGDGFTDLVTLDAGEQMCSIFTFTEQGRMLFATSFEVFDTRLFTGGDAREFEPRQAIIADVTGDDAEDLVLLTHDRVLVYPQMTE